MSSVYRHVAFIISDGKSLGVVTAKHARNRFHHEVQLTDRRTGDWQNTIQTAHHKGVAEGMEKGKAEEKIAIARNMKRMGIPTDAICHATGLTAETVETL